jgi:glycerophosphoryl diester phosphodiesterase
MTAFRRAREDGADTVECDLRLTADRQWVIHHDAAIDLTGQPLRIADLALADLNKVILAAGSDPVPTLPDFLAWCREEAVDPVLDVKDPDGTPELVTCIESMKLPRIPVISSFRRSVLQSVRQARSNWPTALIIGNPKFRAVRRLMFSIFLRRARAHDSGALHLHERWITPRVITAIHDTGMRIAVWTVDDPVRMTLLASLGVDAIITNRPDLARTVIDQMEQIAQP